MKCSLYIETTATKRIQSILEAVLKLLEDDLDQALILLLI